MRFGVATLCQHGVWSIALGKYEEALSTTRGQPGVSVMILWPTYLSKSIDQACGNQTNPVVKDEDERLQTSGERHGDHDDGCQQEGSKGWKSTEVFNLVNVLFLDD